jgi:hypothetical protein
MGFNSGLKGLNYQLERALHKWPCYLSHHEHLYFLLLKTGFSKLMLACYEMYVSPLCHLYHVLKLTPEAVQWRPLVIWRQQRIITKAVPNRNYTFKNYGHLPKFLLY